MARQPLLSSFWYVCEQWMDFQWWPQCIYWLTAPRPAHAEQVILGLALWCRECCLWIQIWARSEWEKIGNCGRLELPDYFAIKARQIVNGENLFTQDIDCIIVTVGSTRTLLSITMGRTLSIATVGNIPCMCTVCLWDIALPVLVDIAVIMKYWILHCTSMPLGINWSEF